MKILIIEDSLVSQRAVQKYLQEYLTNAIFMTARNGEEGLHLYCKNRPDLILLDLLMPIMDGQEVLQEIRKRDTETKIVVITANVQSMVQKEVEDLGIFSFINKPFTREKARELVAQLGPSSDHP